MEVSDLWSSLPFSVSPLQAGRLLLRILVLLLGTTFLTALTAQPASAAARLQAEKVASGSAAVLENLIGENSPLSAERTGENLVLGYDFASDSPVAARGAPQVLRDVVLRGGRGGQNVKHLVGPPNSVVRGGGERAFVTNDKGQVVLDITRGRVKPVTPGEGFGPKRPPTPDELQLLERVLGGGS